MRKHPHLFCPCIEILEYRTLLAARVTASAGDLLVRFRAGVPAAALSGTALGPAVPLVPGLYQVRPAPGVSAAVALAAYRADPDVLYAQPDQAVSAGGGRAPNDPRFTSQWDMKNTGQWGGTPGDDIHAEGAWAITTGSTRTTVAVIDTGIDYDHPDLYENVWINQAEIPPTRLRNLVDVDGDGLITFRDLNDPRNQGVGKITDVNHDGRIDAADILAPMVVDAFGNDTGLGGWAHGSTQDGDVQHPDDLVGWNFVNNTNNPFDDNGHGTHVAGTIGAQGDNGTGVAGVNWNVQLMPLKFLDASGNGLDSNAVAALAYAVRHGALISNNSWVGSTPYPPLADAILAARAAGHIFVAAAGNDGSNNDAVPDYPASYHSDNVVAVAATDRIDRLASFSNYSATTVDLAAPGVDIFSTTPNDTYSWYSGTSMATPHVTGVLALVRSLHPDWSYREVINQVLRTADPVPGLAGKIITGGRLDAAAAVGSSNPDIAFVCQLYHDLLGRAPDPAELDDWTTLLADGLSREQAAQAVWGSAEHRGREVDQYFTTYLHRGADSAGRAQWVAAFLTGADEDEVIAAFLDSPEFQGQHAAGAWIGGLCADVLGRSASRAEQQTWVQALQRGMSRHQLVETLLTSAEGTRQTMTAFYQAFLHRTPTAAEAGSWAGAFERGQVSPAGAATAILGSTEYDALAQTSNRR
jgi:subtilisin family serine protease